MEAAAIPAASHLDTAGRKDNNSASRRSSTTNSLGTALVLAVHYPVQRTQVVSKVLVLAVHYPVQCTQVVSKALQQTADSNNPDRSRLADSNYKEAGNTQKTEHQ